MVLGDKVYLDGGVVSSSSSNGVQYQYSNSLVYIDLSSDFTPETANVLSIPKPAGPPNYWLGGAWVNDGLMYTGFSGRHPPEGDEASSDQGLWSFRPTGDGTEGTWTNLNDTADAYFTTSLRPFIGSVASGNGTGFYLGGEVDYSANDTYQSVSGLVTYDFASEKVSNTTVTGISMDGFASQGQMLYVPNFGPAGVVISAGGRHKVTGDDYMQSFDTVQILDPATGTWYEQATTGSAPQDRVEFCMTGAASSNDTYEIVVYAGWDNVLGSTAIPWDDLYVLSLPSFHWFQASYEALHPRHGLTCEHVGGGQILAVGGVDTTQVASNEFKGCFQTTDNHPQGLAVFDLGSMSFTNSYQRNKTVYDQSSAVKSYYEGSERMADFTNAALKQVFSVQNFTAAATTTAGDDATSGSASASTSGGENGGSGSSSSSSSSAGPIAGGVVGGVALAGIVVGAVFYFLRRRGRRRQAAEGRLYQGAEEGAHVHETSKTPYVEMQGQSVGYHRVELPEGGVYEADTRAHKPRIELP